MNHSRYEMQYHLEDFYIYAKDILEDFYNTRNWVLSEQL